MKRLVLTTLAAIALVTLLGASARAQTSYQFRDLGTLGGDTSTANGVNNAGQVVGGAMPPGSTGYHVFLWLPAPAYGLPAGMNDLGSLGSCMAYGINNAGEIVGYNFSGRALIWLPAPAYGLPAGLSDLNTLPEIGAAGFVATYARAINDNHLVTGQAQSVVDGTSHAYVLDLSAGTFLDLGLVSWQWMSLNNNPMPQVVGPTWMYSFVDNAYTDLTPLKPTGVNNAGGVAGSVFVSNNYHAFYRSASGTLTDLGGLGLPAGRAYGINNAGAKSAFVVGNSYLANGTAHAFRWRVASGPMEDLNRLASGASGFTLAVANAISDAGFIVGYGSAKKGGTHAFLLTPQ